MTLIKQFWQNCAGKSIFSFSWLQIDWEDDLILQNLLQRAKKILFVLFEFKQSSIFWDNLLSNFPLPKSTISWNVNLDWWQLHKLFQTGLLFHNCYEYNEINHKTRYFVMIEETVDKQCCSNRCQNYKLTSEHTPSSFHRHIQKHRKALTKPMP